MTPRVEFPDCGTSPTRLPGYFARSLDRRLYFYARISLLIVDEVGYLSFDARSADLLFQVISGRYEKKRLVLTTTAPSSTGR
jgi:DNA replication protein DnaC